jgi:predicted molibdopterin-dependent oxidoreductase YjgC
MEKARIMSPRIRRHGIIENVTLNEAVNYTAKRIKEIIAIHGKDSVAVFGSPRLSNEELYLLQKFARTGLKNNNITSFADMVYGRERNSLDEITGFTSSTVNMEDMKSADVIIVINSNISDENLVMELKIKEAQKAGAKLVLVNSSELRITKNADLWIDSKKGTSTLLLNSVLCNIIKGGNYNQEYIEKRTAGFPELKKMLHGIDTHEACGIMGIDEKKFESFSEVLGDRSLNIVFIYNIDSNADRSNECLKAIGNVLLLTDRIGKKHNGLLLLREFSNSAGLYELGVTPDYLPGFVKHMEKDEIERISGLWETDLSKVFNPVNLENKLRKGEIKAAIIFGEDPLSAESSRKYFSSIEFLAVMDAFHTSSTDEADVIIPASTSIEQEGSYTRCDGIIQKGTKVINGPQPPCNLEVISKLASRFSEKLSYQTVDRIFEEIKNVNRLYKNTTPGNQWTSSYFSNGFNDVKHCFAEYPIDFTTSEPVRPAVHYQDNYYLWNVKKKLT